MELQGVAIQRFAWRNETPVQQIDFCWSSGNRSRLGPEAKSHRARVGQYRNRGIDWRTIPKAQLSWNITEGSVDVVPAPAPVVAGKARDNVVARVATDEKH